MPLSPQTLSAIQAAGAAAYAADAAIKSAVQDYAQQVGSAMLQNPFDMANDSLFEEWKTVSRLAKAMSLVELELQKIYRAADDLSGGTPASRPAVPMLNAPDAPATSAGADIEVLKEIDATDVLAKKAPAKRRSKAVKGAVNRSIVGNTALLYARLSEVLNGDTFVKVNRSTIAQAVGIPNGSITASFKQLFAKGYLVAGPGKGMKLAGP